MKTGQTLSFSFLIQLQQKPYVFMTLIFAVQTLLITTINATSLIMEGSRNGQSLGYELWKPFVWEYTSAISAIILVPVFITFCLKKPLYWSLFKKHLGWHLLASVAYAVLHVTIMVALRKLIYLTQDQSYQFGHLLSEFFYEYRKDAATYIGIVILTYSYQFIVSRLVGEANLVETGETPVTPPLNDRLLIKKLGKEFIIKVDDIQWLAASGNYVNLHIDDRIYPIRSTLTALLEKIADKGFSRIHRSYGVNLDFVESITPLASGDCKLKLKNQTELNLSRRYRDGLKLQLE